MKFIKTRISTGIRGSVDAWESLWFAKRNWWSIRHFR
jgi:hypothetical protein